VAEALRRGHLRRTLAIARQLAENLPNVHPSRLCLPARFGAG
jgi:hypothetical protein